jgi:protocatechuate 3,4-dioxygenase beta subunit
LSHAGHVLAEGQKPSGSSELTIRVKSSEGPVEGATVVLTSQFAAQRLSVTNAAGVCEFRGLQAGAYSLQVVQRSFFPREESENQLEHIEIRNSQAQSVDFYLVKGGVLKGRVVSIEGSPIIGMPISALKLTGKQPSLPSTRESNATAISDDRGEFRIYGLRPGSYTVAVNAQRGASPLKTFSALFYPGERQLVNATAFDLLLGQEVAIPEMVLDLTQAEQNSLTGVVHGTHGKPLKGVSLTLLSVDSQLSDSILSDDQGQFNFEGLSSGKYLLKASLNSQSYFNLQREIFIKDQATNNVTLELRSHSLITGRAYLKNNAGISPLPSFRLQLESAQNEKDRIELVTDKDGSFSQRSGAEGRFWLTFPELQPEYFVNRILLDDKDITNRPVNLNQASDLTGISIELSAGAAEIRGAVQGGKCQGNVIYVVGLLSKSNEIHSVRKANCSADSFRIRSLAPGRYYVVAMPAGDTISKPNQPARIKQHGIDDKYYDRIERIVSTLKTRGTKPITLDRNQIHENTQPVFIDREMEREIEQ